MNVQSDRDVRLVELVIVLFDQFREHAKTCYAEFELSLPQAAVLLQLDTPLSQRELAVCLRYDASNITAIIDGLEQRRFAERQVDSADRRIRRIVLTAEGQRVVAHLRECLLQEAPLFGELDEDERTELRALLAKAAGARTATSWVELFRPR